MSWHSVHVYYHDDNKDALVLDAVRPLFAALSEHRSYFVRHWRQGPHLRLRLDLPPETSGAELRSAVTEHVGGFLNAHPSTAQLDIEELTRQHELLADFELEQGPLVPWFPDNSIQYVDFDARLDVLGTESAADLVTTFYTETTGLAFSATELIRAGRVARLSAAFDLMVATAHRFSESGITDGFISFRSHAEGFLCGGWPWATALRPVWDEHHALAGDRLANRVRQVVGTLEGAEYSVRFVRDWVTALAPIHQHAGELLTSGELPLGQPRVRNASDEDSRLGLLSPFHHRLENNERWLNEIRHSTGFGQYRAMLNFTYLQMTRLGITPVERVMLCHLAANAVEDTYGVSALDLVSR